MGKSDDLKTGSMPGRTVSLVDEKNNKLSELPILDGTIGPSVIDIRKLYGDTGHFTYDPGFTATGSCESAITYIDGEKGELLHRGYAIEDLAKNSDFMEVAYLLLESELPTADQKKTFVDTIRHHTMVHEQLIYFFRGFRRDAHPMAIMVGVVGALSRLLSQRGRRAAKRLRAHGGRVQADRENADHRGHWRTNIPSASRSSIRATT